MKKNVFASLAALEYKFVGIIGSSRGLAAHLGHVEHLPAESEVFDVLYVPAATVYPPPAHFHLGVLADVVALSGRELRLVELYDLRLERQARPATETEQRRVRVLLKAVYARCAVQMLHVACKAHRADYTARQRAASMKEAV